MAITNATEIYSVDYLNNSNTIASILALKTEDGVYEHTKYICDRLLGAELLSVSTITINDQPFIRSIIKNVDGTYEYVLSLSAKQINTNTNFEVESHWNLDQYEQNVTYYNFQIWANSMNGLYVLAQEVLHLLDTARPIASYNNSTPPTVFVKKGKYINGGLELQIINTNVTSTVNLDAGYRATETTDFLNFNQDISLNDAYITDTFIQTGRLFDIGFRIGDGIATPDDLFMSDGPWGLDDSQSGTEIIEYNVTENTTDFDAADFPVERNVVLRANTDSYVAAYRALTPRFKAVNLSDYNSLKFSASGTGNVEVTFVKESITNWENQFKTTVTLTGDMQDFVIPVEDFQNNFGENNPTLNDVVTIVFTMASDDGSMQSKTMDLQDLRLSQQSALSVNEYELENHTVGAYPNPMVNSTTLKFTLAQNETVQLVVYNQLGKQVYNKPFKAVAGTNEMSFYKNNLSSGLYFCKIISEQHQIETLKLIIK